METITGIIKDILPMETLQGRNGVFNKQTVVVEQHRYDPETGEEWGTRTYAVEFSQQKIDQLKGLAVGRRVDMTIWCDSRSWQPQQGAERWFSTIHGSSVKLHEAQADGSNTVATGAPQPVESDGLPF
ncbi:DUF3127 domain-containing protein [Prevotella sp. KH2C16]|uniref:DUF3127 domain-containing protein n=1 Tax=Prevotella sp. KH2C16 TaxID=1855325 RepID=UPI0008EFE89B|nr:DUF3127 domain-containing protein [Prevotella sp. KH2C16]SFG12983.1 protein of unknown function [Prevotella sp. KH2C16]